MPDIGTRRVEIDYAPRKWAQKLHANLLRWAVLVLHRRAGKTTGILNHHQRYAMDDALERQRLSALGVPSADIPALLRDRVYWHVMPSYKQAKMVAWEMVKYYARPIPGVTFNESELRVLYPTGHRLQLIGADNPDSLRGPALSGVSLDEFSQHPPNVFSEILSKALGDHLGYAIFAGTIKGQDQLWRTYGAADHSPDWFAVWQDIDQSLATESGPTITALTRAMEDDRKLVAEGIITQDEFDQEWYLSAEAAIKGAIYGKELTALRQQDRFTRVPYDPLMTVETDWDLGVGDATAIWFSQSTRAGEVRLIDYYEASGEGLPHYATVLTQRGYNYGQHWAPHDIQVRELGSGKSRLEIAESLGIRFQIVPQIGMEDGIHAARLLLPRCWFDEGKTRAGVEALRHYRREFNSRLNEFKETPVHDRFSHGADAFRGLAVRHQVPELKQRKQVRPWMPAHTGTGWMA